MGFLGKLWLINGLATGGLWSLFLPYSIHVWDSRRSQLPEAWRACVGGNSPVTRTVRGSTDFAWLDPMSIGVTPRVLFCPRRSWKMLWVGTLAEYPGLSIGNNRSLVTETTLGSTALPNETVMACACIEIVRLRLHGRLRSSTIWPVIQSDEPGH